MADLNLMAVVRLSGLSEHVLRAWEKRYQAVTPKRAENGRRLYTLEDLEKLRLLSSLVNQGYAIRNVASLEIHELKKLLNDLAPKSAVSEASPKVNFELVQRLIENLKSFDFNALDQNLRAARFQFSPKSFVLEIAGPVMAEIGIQVAHDQLSIAQEHALSAIIRDHLGEIFRSVQTRTETDKTVILSTPEDDLHEFGILLAGVLFASAGWKTYYLGPNLPARDLIKATAVIQPKLIIMGCSPVPAMNRKKPLETYLNHLDETLPSVPIWLGGAGVPEHWEPSSQRVYKRLKSLEELATLLGV